MKAVRAVGLFLGLWIWSLSASSLPITDIITGADMAGINVTAYFNGGSESAAWVTTSTDASVPDGEGFAGEAAGTGWSLSQQGFTLGNISAAGIVLGAWTISNDTGFDITRLEIDALVANIVFDLDLDNVWTPGSNIGRDYISDETVLTSAVYSDVFSAPDLFGSLAIEFTSGLSDGNSMRFLADTDALVPSPATAWLFAIGVAGLFINRFSSGQRAGQRVRLGYAS